MKKLTILLLWTTFTFAQVGIGTNNPDLSAQLEINSSDKGLLIPRVNLNNITTTKLDGINTSATGLMIYNTNAAVIGGNGVGFYYFNGTTWKRLITSDTNIDDKDWYEENTTNAPTSINDDIYTQGNVAIGKTTAGYALDVSTSGFRSLNILNNSTSTSTTSTGIHNSLTGNGHNKTGIINSIEDTGGTGGQNIGVNNIISLVAPSTNIYATFNRFDNASASNIYGVFNKFRSQTSVGSTFGAFNDFSSSGSDTKYGLYNTFGGSFNTVNGKLYGVYNNFTNTGNTNPYDKYGVYTSMPSTLAGNLYGIYSSVTKASGYAGYFLGNVSIGTTTANNYILPVSRGTDEQIMQTDASGNVSWADINSNFTMVSAYATANYNTIIGSSPAWESMTLDTEDFDTNSEFDITGSKFTAITSGYYQVTAQFTTHSSTAVPITVEIGIGIFKNGNGTPITESTEHQTVNGIIQRQVTKLVYLNALDTLSFGIQDGGEVLVIDAFSGKTFVTINRVR